MAETKQPYNVTHQARGFQTSLATSRLTGSQLNIMQQKCHVTKENSLDVCNKMEGTARERLDVHAICK